MIYKTNISPVFSRNPANALKTAGKAQLLPLSKEWNLIERTTKWVDELCNGGIYLPDDLKRGASPRGRSVVMLLTGPSGTGKSTFALELSSRLVATARKAGTDQQRFNALYVSAEESANRLIHKVQQFGWLSANAAGTDRAIFNHGGPYDHAIPDSSLIVMGKEALPRTRDVSTVFSQIADNWRRAGQQFTGTFLHSSSPLDLVVIDSLNVISPAGGDEERVRIFDAIQSNMANPESGSNPSLLLLILDSPSDGSTSSYWEYVSDIVFRFGWDYSPGYALRTFEIKKMRDQKHAWGLHRLKIYEGNGDSAARQHEAPYLSQGGIFVFPSINWHLSVFRDERASRPQIDGTRAPLPVPRKIDELNKQISLNPQFQGFPVQGCTALVGRRGAMKSHLANMFLLDQAMKGRKNCLLVTLRDDLESAIQTLSQIAEDNGYVNQGQGEKTIRKLIREDRLEILHNEIGRVSPEEFFHKIYVAVKRNRVQRTKRAAEVVVVNGLDQLEARFPLIAAEGMFVPALCQLLKGCEVCSVIISAVGESSSTAGQSLYGLLPMADLILRIEPFDPLQRSPDDQREWPKQFPSALKDAVDSGAEQISSVETQRVPGGQVGGRIGFLYRQNDGKLAYCRYTTPND